MIYSHIGFKRPFDDSIIRSVDAVVNTTFNKNISLDVKQHMPDNIYEREFRTVFIQLPRRCGKTVYLNKLLDHFRRNTGLNTWLVVPNMAMKKESYCNHSKVLTLREINDPNNYIFCRWLNGLEDGNKPEVMLYDEVHPHTENIVRGSKFTLGLYT